MSNHDKINYVELPATKLTETKAFFSQVFSWKFEDYGPEYSAIIEGGLDGGFYQSELVASTATGSALVVIFSDNLESTLDKIEPAGGKIVKDIFSFPGGRRFHFADPSGNEWAVWSDKE